MDKLGLEEKHGAIHDDAACKAKTGSDINNMILQFKDTLSGLCSGHYECDATIYCYQEHLNVNGRGPPEGQTPNVYLGVHIS